MAGGGGGDIPLDTPGLFPNLGYQVSRLIVADNNCPLSCPHHVVKERQSTMNIYVRRDCSTVTDEYTL